MKQDIDTSAIEDGLFAIQATQDILWNMSKALEAGDAEISWQTLYFLSNQIQQAQKQIDIGAQLYIYNPAPEGHKVVPLPRSATH